MTASGDVVISGDDVGNEKDVNSVGGSGADISGDAGGADARDILWRH